MGSLAMESEDSYNYDYYELTPKVPERKWSLPVVPIPSAKTARYSSESDAYYATVTEKPSLITRGLNWLETTNDVEFWNKIKVLLDKFLTCVLYAIFIIACVFILLQ